MFIYDEEGATQGKRTTGVPNDEFFAKVVSEVVRLLSAHTDRGLAYRIDLRLRPEGHRGPLARSLASTLSYYDSLGRTWERQALIKVRPAAGDLALGQRFVQAVEPFVYRKYLTFAEINEIKALKRRIEQKASQAGVSATEVKTGRGGIRDIEFTIQFLQLLNGGDLPAVRHAIPFWLCKLWNAPAASPTKSISFWTTPIAFCARRNIGCNCCSTCKHTVCRKTPRNCASWRCA